MHRLVLGRPLDARSGALTSSWRARGYAVACDVSVTGTVRIDQLITYVIDYAANALRQPDAHELGAFTALQAHHRAIGQDDAAHAAWCGPNSSQPSERPIYASMPQPRSLLRCGSDGSG